VGEKATLFTGKVGDRQDVLIAMRGEEKLLKTEWKRTL